MPDLTKLEQKLLLLLRSLKPYERIEVKYEKQGEITVTVYSTVRESFPVDGMK
jgi:predicted ribosome quality control (RQC) complex YloA/Tae2 family protein